jgi:hypothetical protein
MPLWLDLVDDGKKRLIHLIWLIHPRFENKLNLRSPEERATGHASIRAFQALLSAIGFFLPFGLRPSIRALRALLRVCGGTINDSAHTGNVSRDSA